MREIDLTADELVSILLALSATEPVCLLDSSGVEHLGSHLLIAGISPISVSEYAGDDPLEALRALDKAVSDDVAAFFTISYDLGRRLLDDAEEIDDTAHNEPDVFISTFDSLVVHDYHTSKTFISGDDAKFDEIAAKLFSASVTNLEDVFPRAIGLSSNFSRAEYLRAIESIKERIRCGDTYQTNLTHQLSAELPNGLMPAAIFSQLRRDHPAPFAAFIDRPNSTVVSASPERFFRIDRETESDGPGHLAGKITTSPIKGTRPRGKTPAEDEGLRNELLNSAKDRAENTMIVDLLRNDIGRVCEYGSVHVENLCELEEHPTLFHLVSTVSGRLREGFSFSDILRAVFPCGSITGAPKISTMRIINEIETAKRGLSMGAIGYSIPNSRFGVPMSIDLSVAIRTIVIRGNEAFFNVGGGIVIDSDPPSEYDESLVKAKALLAALGLDREQIGSNEK